MDIEVNVIGICIIVVKVFHTKIDESSTLEG